MSNNKSGQMYVVSVAVVLFHRDGGNCDLLCSNGLRCVDGQTSKQNLALKSVDTAPRDVGGRRSYIKSRVRELLLDQVVVHETTQILRATSGTGRDRSSMAQLVDGHRLYKTHVLTWPRGQEQGIAVAT